MNAEPIVTAHGSALRALEAAERAAVIAAEQAQADGDDLARRAWQDAAAAIGELRLGIDPSGADRHATADEALEHVASRLPDGYRVARHPQTGALVVEVDAEPGGGVGAAG
jgi:hypothetical protein